MTPKTTHLTVGSVDVPLVKDKIRLYSMRFCPYAQRVHLVLYAKNIPHDIVYLNLKNKPDWYLEKVSSGKVPAIVIRNETITESLVISDLLDEDCPERPLYPKDPIKKAKDRLLVEAFGKAVSLLYKCYLQPTLDPELFKPVLKELDDFEKEITKRGSVFFGGDKPGMVDYMIWPWMERLDMLRVLGGNEFSLPKSRFARLSEWCHSMTGDEAVKKHFISPENHAKYLQSHKAGTPDYDNIL